MLDIYYQYRRVIARFRSGALGNEIDRIAADLSRVGYKYDSIKIYLSRIARFSAYASRCGYSKSTPIDSKVVDRFLQRRSTRAARWTAQTAIGHARRCFPQRFAVRPVKRDPDSALLAAYPVRGSFCRRGGCWHGIGSISAAGLFPRSPPGTFWP